MQDLSIYIGLHLALKIVAKESIKHFLSNIWRKFIFFSTFEPKKCRSVFQAAMSACILQILCCGYNRATQKRRKFIKDYDTRICKENSFFLSLRKQGCKSASYAIYTLYYTHKKVRLSVFYLNSHNYSLNCKKEWWTIFCL